MSTQKYGDFPPKWMVKIMENPIKMDDLGVPLFLETPKRHRISALVAYPPCCQLLSRWKTTHLIPSFLIASLISLRGLLRSYFLGWVALGTRVPLTSHDGITLRAGTPNLYSIGLVHLQVPTCVHEALQCCPSCEALRFQLFMGEINFWINKISC